MSYLAPHSKMVYVVVELDNTDVTVSIYQQKYTKIAGVFSLRQDAEDYCRVNRIGHNLIIHATEMDKDINHGIKKFTLQ